MTSPRRKLPEVNAEFAKPSGIQDGDVARLRDEN